MPSVQSKDRSDAAGSSETGGHRADDSRLPTPRVAVELARVDVVRGLRWVGAQDFWLLYGAVSALGMAFGCLFAFDLGHGAGVALADGESTWFTTTGAATLWSTVWLFLTALLAVDAVGSNGDVSNDGYYLTIRPVADVAGGKLLAAAGKFAVFVYVPVVACFGGLALGAGTAWPLVGAFAAATVVVVSATAVGYPLGFLAKGAIRRSATLTRLKPLIGTVVGVGYLVVMLTGEFVSTVQQLEPVLQSPPLGWFADLSFVTTPGVTVPPLAVAGALGASAAAVGAGILLSTPTADYAWRADRTRSTEKTDGAASAPDHWVDDLLAVVTRRPATRGVASTTLLRVYRSPLQLTFVAFPLVGAIPVGEQLLASGTLPWYAPWLAVWYGAWAAGAAVPLNPLGTQGAALPALLTSPADGRDVVNGNVVAAALPAAPLTAVAAVGVGSVAGHTTVELTGIAVAAVAAVVAACVIAVGIGSIFPRFDAIDFSGSRRAVPPSKVAYTAFSTILTLSVVAVAVVLEDLAADVLALLLTRHAPFVATVDSAGVVTGAWVVLFAVALGVPVAYRVAVGRIRAYRLS